MNHAAVFMAGMASQQISMLRSRNQLFIGIVTVLVLANRPFS